MRFGKKLQRILALFVIFSVFAIYQNCAKNDSISPGDSTQPSTVSTPLPLPIPVPMPNNGPIADPYVSDVVLLMHFDVDLSDATGRHIATSVGNPQVSTTQSQFGGGSLYLDGSSYLTLPASPDWDLSSQDSTVEAWVYPTALGSGITQQQGILSQAMTLNDGNWWFGLTTTELLAQLNNGTQDIDGGTLTLNTWQHVALSRQQGYGSRLFVNGLQAAAAAVSPFNISTNALYVGASNVSTSPTDFLFHGYIDELRVTKGYARYTTSFAPPSNPTLP